MSERRNPGQVPELKAVKLDYPVVNGDEVISELRMQRRLQAGDFRGIRPDDLKFDDMFLLVSRLFGVPTSIIQQLDSTDFFKCAEIVNSFLPGGQQTGASR